MTRIASVLTFVLDRGRAAVEKGRTTGTPTPRERAYLAAVANLFNNVDTVSHRDRTLAARAAEVTGDRAKARQLYQTLLNIDRSSEAERPELQRARAFLKSA